MLLRDGFYCKSGLFFLHGQLRLIRHRQQTMSGSTAFIVSQSTQSVLDDTFSPREQVCDKVKQRIADIAEETRALHTCYNRFVPVNRLGPEILSSIFQMLQQVLVESERSRHPSRAYRRARRSRWRSDSHSESGSRASCSRLEWLKVMRVCRYWRAAAIDCPTLWANLTFHTPALAQLMLHRAKNAPLSIIASTKSENYTGWQSQFWSNEGWRDVIRSTLSRIGQLHSVELEAGEKGARRRNFLNLLSVLSGSTASVLERLVILGHGEGVELPEDFASGGTPKLKHLQLKSCSFSLQILTQATQLTHLHVHWSSLCRQDRPPADALFPSLQNLRHLQTLNLANFLPADSAFLSDGTTMRSPLSFQALRSLTLQDSTSTITSFICNMRIPASARVHAVFNDFKKDANVKFKPLATPLSFDTFLLALNNSWRDSPEDDPRTAEGVLELRLIDFASYSDSVSRMEFWFAAYETSADLTIDFLTDKIGVNSILNIVDKRLDLSAVMDLTVRDCDSFTNKEIWHTLGTLLYRMENLTVTNSPLTTFLNALLDDAALADAPREMDSAVDGGPYVSYGLYDDDDHYPDVIYEDDSEDDEDLENGIDHDNEESDRTPLGPFPYFPALWFLEIRVDFGFRKEAKLEVDKLVELVKRRPNNHDIMEILFEECTNFTDEYFELIREAIPQLEIDWDCDEELYTETSELGDESDDAPE